MIQSVGVTSPVRRMLAQIFLLVPVVFIFAGVEIFVNTHFDTTLFKILGIQNFVLYFYPTGQLDEKGLFAVILMLWSVVMLFFSVIRSVFKINLRVNPRMVNRFFHVLSFVTWMIVAISYNELNLKGILVLIFLHLMSYGSVVMYVMTIENNKHSN